MSFPEWIEEMGPDIYIHDAKLRVSLTIALEALEMIIANPSAKCSNEHDIVAQDAMRRIEEMGK